MQLRLGSTRSAACALLVASVAAGTVSAQTKGATTCFKCHKPNAKDMWETQAPFHKKSTEQLSSPKAAAFAAAIGLASPTTVTGKPGDCVSCHANVVAGAPSEGVSCESCHGAAGGYFKPHQEPDFYDKSVAQRLGMRDMFNNAGAIAAVCVDCHVTPDPRLKKAGHPAGEGFDPGKGIAKMVHWDSGISEKRKRSGYGPALYAKVSTEGSPLVAKRLASAGAGGGAAPAAAPAAKPAGPAAAPAAPATGPAAAPAAPAATGGSRAPRPKAAAPDPFDWDQPVAELPANYPGDGGAAAPAAPAAPAAAPGTSAPAAAPAVRPQAPSTAPEAPPVPAEPALAPAGTASAKPAAIAKPVFDPARPPAAQVSALRGQAAVALSDLLRSKAGTLALAPPTPPLEYKGPDGELLRIQDEILYLTLTALRKPEP